MIKSTDLLHHRT